MRGFETLTFLDEYSRYWVKDELLEMVPPPAEIWPEVIRILGKDTQPATASRRSWLAGLRREPPFPPFPVGGKLPVQFGKATVEFDILFFRGRTGEHIWVEQSSRADVSAAAAEFFRVWNARRHDSNT